MTLPSVFFLTAYPFPVGLFGNSPGPFIFSIRQKLKDFTENDYLLLNGDPAIIGVTCAIAAEMTHVKFKLLKWDRQEKTYYPIEINIYQK